MKNISRKDDLSPFKSAIAFHNEIAGSWSKGYKQGSFNRRLRALQPSIDRNVKPGSRWMDMGCGSGVLVGELLGRGANVVGVDGAPAMIENARAAYAKEVRAEFIISNVAAVQGCADQAFDGILCSSVLEYVDEPQSLLWEAYRLLRSDGRLILTVAGKFSAVRLLQHVARRGARLIGKDMFSYLDYSRFTQSAGEITAMLKRNGFVINRIESFDPCVPPYVHRILKPAILIIEARKMVQGDGGHDHERTQQQF